MRDWLSSPTISRPESTDAIYSAVSCTSTGELHEHLCAPHTVRSECLDWLLIVGRGHLDRVLRVYVAHYNRHRPHRALELQSPDPSAGVTILTEARLGQVHRHDLLGGLLREYRRAA